MLFILLTTVIVVYFITTAFYQDHERRAGIYGQPGPFYGIKWILVYIFYRLKTAKFKTKSVEYDDGADLRYLEDKQVKTGQTWQVDSAVGLRSKTSPVFMERIQEVEDSPFAIDDVYFNAFEEKNASVCDDVSMSLGFTKRHRNFAEILFQINIPGVGFLQHPCHPDRIICNVSSDDYVYNGQGISIEMLEPMRRWRVSYNGLLSEMMTGAMTPLTSSIFIRALNYAFEKYCRCGLATSPLTYCDAYVSECIRHPFINYMEILSLNKYTNITAKKESVDIAFFGEVMKELREEEAMRYHNNYMYLPRRIWATVLFWKTMFDSTKKYKKLLEDSKSLEMCGETSKELYRSISENLTSCYAEGWNLYSVYASLSAKSNKILMMVLAGGNEWKTEHYSDVAMIYGTCEDVVSADVPKFLKKVAKQIHESVEKASFLDKSPQEATEWLIQDESEAGAIFRNFLDECGHRCIREVEFREKSWKSVPGKVGPPLQAAVRNYKVDSPKKKLSVSDAIANLKSELSPIKKSLLKFLIPKARQSVGAREWGKSMVVKLSDRFKQAYWKLATRMKDEGYLPDDDLMFFLTHGEIGRVLRTRSPRLITRAIRRRRIQDRITELKFPVLSKAVPVAPIDENEVDEENEDHLVIQGCPVSHGVTKGVARVVLNLEHANEIKQGEILIVRTTDVGWSPYFPLVTGLITEIGGLISHGAVVAREYGLPCIVGAKRATRLFKTGDHVLLDGGRGILRKIKHGKSELSEH